jgi:hypothetical protein
VSEFQFILTIGQKRIVIDITNAWHVERNREEFRASIAGSNIKYRGYSGFGTSISDAVEALYTLLGYW